MNIWISEEWKDVYNGTCRTGLRLKSDKDVAYGTFFEPDNKFVEPYIKIATGDYISLYHKYGKDSAIATILHTIAHELTHYYQWINSSKLTDLGEERQANKIATIILDMYSETREHP